MRGLRGAGCLILSQSEDQSRPHPAPAFVRSMSTQVRGLGSNTVRGALRSDPQIASRTRVRATRQAAGYLKLRMNHLELCPETTRTAPSRPDPGHTASSKD